jgi:hypothetical protein
MGAQVYLDRPGETAQPGAPDEPADAELEIEVQAVAAWFDDLPVEWQRYFDEEATRGQDEYGRA